MNKKLSFLFGFFALVSPDGSVLQVIVAKDMATADLTFSVMNQKKKNYSIVETFEETGKRRANLGDSFDKDTGLFIRPKPFPSWTLNKAKGDWDPPVAKPVNPLRYKWDENRQTWTLKTGAALEEAILGEVQQLKESAK